MTTHLGAAAPPRFRAASWAGGTTHRLGDVGSADRYRGVDRRGVVADEGRAPGPGFAVAAGVTVAATGVAVLVQGGGDPAAVDVTVLQAQLDAAALGLAVPLAILYLVRWRLATEAAAAWLGAALALYGLVAVGLEHALTRSATTAAGLVAALPGAARLVAIAMVVAALLAPEVDTSVRPRRLLAGAVVATIAVAAGSAQVGVVHPAPGVVALLWGLLGGSAIAIGVRGRRHLLTWCGLAFLTFAVADVVATWGPHGSLGTLLTPSLRLLGLAWALAGATRGLARAYLRQNGRLFAAMTAELLAEREAEAVRARADERAHEARNAVAAIEAATLALGYQARRGGSEDGALADAMTAELRRLGRLVDPRPADPGAATCFDLRELVGPIAACTRTQGTPVTVDVPEGLLVRGEAAKTTQVLHNLLQNVRRYGGGHVTIRAVRNGPQVVVRVVDRGPGIPVEERTAIFERGFRGSASADTAGDGFGLFIARRLMSEQGGQLRLEHGHHDGACFALVLPAGGA